MAVSKGMQTTEFALVILVNVASIASTLSGLIPASGALIIMAAINAVYGILRTIIKINDPAYVAPELPTPLPGK